MTFLGPGEVCHVDSPTPALTFSLGGMWQSDFMEEENLPKAKTAKTQFEKTKNIN